MKNLTTAVFCASGAVTYIINSELLPVRNHFLVGLFTGLSIAAAYWLLPKKLNIWIRIAGCVAFSVAAAAAVRYFCS